MASPTLVEWSPRALRDLIAIHRITALDNPRAAIAQQNYIIERTEALASYPRLGKASHWRGRRVLVLTRYPYSIYYRRVSRKVRVLRVVHQKRHFP